MGATSTDSRSVNAGLFISEWLSEKRIATLPSAAADGGSLEVISSGTYISSSRDKFDMSYRRPMVMPLPERSDHETEQA